MWQIFDHFFKFQILTSGWIGEDKIFTFSVITRSVFTFMKSCTKHSNRSANLHKWKTSASMCWQVSGHDVRTEVWRKNVFFLVLKKTITTRSVFFFIRSSIVHSNRFANLQSNNVFSKLCDKFLISSFFNFRSWRQVGMVKIKYSFFWSYLGQFSLLWGLVQCIRTALQFYTNKKRLHECVDKFQVMMSGRKCDGKMFFFGLDKNDHNSVSFLFY